MHASYPSFPGWLKHLEVSRILMVGTNAVDAHCGLALKAATNPSGYLWICWRVLFAQAALGEMLTVTSSVDPRRPRAGHVCHRHRPTV